jgi:hypothetical protein
MQSNYLREQGQEPSRVLASKKNGQQARSLIYNVTSSVFWKRGAHGSPLQVEDVTIGRGLAWVGKVVKHVQKAKVAAFKEVVAMEIKVFKQLTSHPGPFWSPWPVLTSSSSAPAQRLKTRLSRPRTSSGWHVAMT